MSAIEEVTGRDQSAARTRSGKLQQTTSGARGVPRGGTLAPTHGECRAQGLIQSRTQQRSGKERRDRAMLPATWCAAESSSDCEARDLRDNSFRAERRAASA